MATFLPRLGRIGSFKCLRLESWGFLSNHSAATFCTQAGEPPRPTHKPKAASKTAEIPDERAILLGYKTAVAFPVRLSEPGFFPAQSLSEVELESVVGSIAAAETSAEPVSAAAEPLAPAGLQVVGQVIADTAPPVAEAAAEPLVEASIETPASVSGTATTDAVPPVRTSAGSGEPAADTSSSSSSSESDSDSDSDFDSDDKMLEEKTKPKTLPLEVSEAAATDGAKTQEAPPDVKEDAGDAREAAPAADQGSAADALSFSSEEFIDSAPEISTAMEDMPEGAVIQAGAADAAESTPGVTEDESSPAVHEEVVTKAATPETDTAVQTADPASAEALVEAPAEAAPAEAAEDPVEAVETAATETPEVVPNKAANTPAEAAETAAEPVEAAATAAAEVSAPVEEQLVDSAPVIAGAAGEELQAEAPVEPPEEAVPPEPEEPFDNSTYKNYQHHSYHPFTFADLDVEMAKFRLPQPSSGRH